MTMLDNRTQTNQAKPIKTKQNQSKIESRKTATDVLNKESTQFGTITEPRIVLVNLYRPIV